MIEEGPMKEHIERSKEGVIVAKYLFDRYFWIKCS